MTSTRPIIARVIVAAALGGTAVLGVGGSWAPVSGAAEAGTPAGQATTAGVFASYSDQENFFPGAATVPPSTWAPLATGGFENTGTGHAQAAFVYNPYQDAPGAVNALRPPGTPEFPTDELRSREYASVRGEAPQSHDASVVPSDASLPGGRAHAALEEDGPSAVAEVIAAAAEPAPDVKVEAVTSRIRVSRTGGQAAVSTATTILEGITVAGTVAFESIVVTATSTADGETGESAATVRVNGATVGGTAVTITDEGVVVADTEVPVGNPAVSDALEEAGLELLAPGDESTRPAGDNSTAEARGPSFRLTTSQNHQFEFVLGLASTTSVLFDASGSTGTGPALGGTTEAAGPEPAAGGGAPSRNGSAVASEGVDATTSSDSDLEPFGDEPFLSPPVVAAAGDVTWRESFAAGTDAGTGLPEPSRQASPVGASPAVASTSETATSRIGVLYGALAVVGLGFLTVALGMPPGDRWAEDV